MATDKSTDWKSESLKHKTKRLTHAGRQANIAAKIKKFKASGGVQEESDEEDD
jgi:large subunit ribosomal protein L5e